MYTRASASDYNDWKNVHENPGWGSDELIPLLKKVTCARGGRRPPLSVFLSFVDCDGGCLFARRRRLTKFPLARQRTEQRVRSRSPECCPSTLEINTCKSYVRLIPPVHVRHLKPIPMISKQSMCTLWVLCRSPTASYYQLIRCLHPRYNWRSCRDGPSPFTYLLYVPAVCRVR